MAAASPVRPPRLPSPPPIAEDLSGHHSPSVETFGEDDKLDIMFAADNASSRRIKPGSKSEDMFEGPPLIDLQDIESPFPLTEHLKALYSNCIGATNGTVTSNQAIDKEMAIRLAQPPPSVDRGIWLYELCRFLTQKANVLATGLFAIDPPCSASTCHEMRAGEWQYLCAAHDPPKSCCAIDYCCHTLDWAATQLTSSKLFPSRMALGTESATSSQQVRKMTEIFRRVYRIFAHAWFQHDNVFWAMENETGLYTLFKTVCDEYKLIPEDNYTIPPEAEGVKELAEEKDATSTRRIASRDELGTQARLSSAEHVTFATGDTTKRHRARPSSMSSISTVIHEEGEEDEEQESASQTLATSNDGGNSMNIAEITPTERDIVTAIERPSLSSDILPDHKHAPDTEASAAGDGDAKPQNEDTVDDQRDLDMKSTN